MKKLATRLSYQAKTNAWLNNNTKSGNKPSSPWSISSPSSSDDVHPVWWKEVLLEEPTSFTEEGSSSAFIASSKWCPKFPLPVEDDESTINKDRK